MKEGREGKSGERRVIRQFAFQGLAHYFSKEPQSQQRETAFSLLRPFFAAHRGHRPDRDLTLARQV